MREEEQDRREAEWRASARLVCWAADDSGYVVRVEDRHGQTLGQIETPTAEGPPGSGAHEDPQPTARDAVERSARHGAEALAGRLGVAFVARGRFPLPWNGAARPDTGGTEEPDLVYGVIDGALVFLAPEEARELAACHAAWNPPITWGELRAKVAPVYYDELCRLFDETEPDPDSPIDTEEFDPYGDGTWPGWPAQEMLDWVPDEIAQEFGRVEESFVSGHCLTFPTGREEDLVAAFRDHGYECRRDDTLVRQACGYAG